MFAIAFTRAVVGRHLLEVNPCFDRLARDRGFYRDELIAEIAQRGGVRGCPQLPAAVRAAFPTAAEIAPEWHLRMQAAVQRHVDAAVSKTVNLPATATVDDVRADLSGRLEGEGQGHHGLSLRQPRGPSAVLRRAGTGAGPSRYRRSAAAAPGGPASSDSNRADARFRVTCRTLPAQVHLAAR